MFLDGFNRLSKVFGVFRRFSLFLIVLAGLFVFLDGFPQFLNVLAGFLVF